MKIKLKEVILIILVFPLIIGCSASQAERYPEGYNLAGWPHWRGINHDSFSSDINWNTDLPEDLEPMWQADIGIGYSAPSIQGSNLIAMGSFYGEDGNFYERISCLDPLSGKEKWVYEYESEHEEYDGTKSSPTIDGERVYTLSPFGLLHCLNIKNGKVIWSIDIAKEFDLILPYYNISSSIIIEEDTLLINAGRSGMALTKDGELMWRSESTEDFTGHSSPVVFDYKNKRAAVMLNDFEVNVVEVANGNIITSFEFEGANHSDPLVFDEKIFLSSYYGIGCILIDISKDEPFMIWENNNLSSNFSSSFYRDGKIYGTDGGTDTAINGSIVCLDSETGEQIWKYENSLSSFIMVNDIMIALSSWGRLSFVEIADSNYTELSSANVIERLCWTAPIFAYGIIYVRNDLGDLVAINVRN